MSLLNLLEHNCYYKTVLELFNIHENFAKCSHLEDCNNRLAFGTDETLNVSNFMGMRPKFILIKLNVLRESQSFQYSIMLN